MAEDLRPMKVVIVEYRLKNLESRAVEIFTRDPDPEKCKHVARLKIFDKYKLRDGVDYIITDVIHANKPIA